jgi:hypothetical protein
MIAYDSSYLGVPSRQQQKTPFLLDQCHGPYSDMRKPSIL